MPIDRSPRDQVLAAIANLRMASQCARNREATAKTDCMSLAFCAEAGAYAQAATLIETECTQLLNPQPMEAK